MPSDRDFIAKGGHLRVGLHFMLAFLSDGSSYPREVLVNHGHAVSMLFLCHLLIPKPSLN